MRVAHCGRMSEESDYRNYRLNRGATSAASRLHVVATMFTCREQGSSKRLAFWGDYCRLSASLQVAARAIVPDVLEDGLSDLVGHVLLAQFLSRTRSTQRTTKPRDGVEISCALRMHVTP